MSSAVPVTKINYQGNSKLDKAIEAETAEEEKPRLKKIEGVSVTKTKPTLGKRIRENFGGQNLKTVAIGVLMEVVLPTGKDLLSDIIREASDRTIYGESGRRRNGTSALAQTIVGSGTRIRSTNYNGVSNQPRNVNAPNTSLSARERQQFDFSNLVFADRYQVEEVLERMSDAISEFGMVTVGDLFDLLEETGNGFTDRKFGWDARAFAPAQPAKTREGWILDLPQPLEVK